MKNKVFPLLLLLVFAVSGCTINIKTKTGLDGGVYKSVDNGDEWQQVSLLYRIGDVEKNFYNSNLTSMLIDETDNKAIYVGTEKDGLFYTYDGGIGWQQTLVNLGVINDIAINPKNHCIIYAAISNRVYKSSDCSRHWEYQLIETRDNPNDQINSLTIDSVDPNTIYVGTSGRGFFRSDDAGYSWRVVNFFNDSIVKILVNKKDDRIIYVATVRNGIFKSIDKGATWQDIFSKEQISAKKNILVYRKLIADPTVDDGLFYASQYGLTRSNDGGRSWEDLKLLTPPSTTYIYSLAINPKNGQDIYYGTNAAMYRSIDAGKNWITRKLPTTRAAKFLIMDFNYPNILYMGVKQIQEKEKYL